MKRTKLFQMLSTVWMALFLLCIPAAHAQCDFAVTPGNPYTEGFENGISCWTTEYVMDNIDWEVVTSMDYGPVVTPHGGTHCAQFFYGDYDVTTRLVSPVIDLSAVDAAVLSFWHAQGKWLYDQNTLKVYYRTSPSEAWTQLAHYTNEITSWTREELTLPSLSATFQIAFEGIGNYGYPIVIDDITIERTSSCVAPTNVAATNVMPTFADITWESDNAANWDVEYGVSGFTHGNGTIISTTTQSCNLPSLAPNTSYDVYVRSFCNDGEQSNWSNVLTISTALCIPAPPIVDGDGITSVTFGQVQEAHNTTHPSEEPFYGDYTDVVGICAAGTSATVDITYNTGWTYGTVIWVNWNNDCVFTDDEVVYTGESTDDEPTTLSCTFTIPANTPIGSYTMRIGGSDEHFDDMIADNEGFDPCYSGNYTIYEDYTLQIAEPPTCLAPSNLTLDTLDAHSATLDWTSNDSESEWEIIYNGQTVTATEHPYTLTGLTPATDYSVRVRALCSETDSSFWSPVLNFTTDCDIIYITENNPYTQDFSSTTFPPVCWSQERTAAGSGYGTDYPDGAWNRYAYSLDDNSTPMAELRDTRAGSKHNLVMPPMNFTYAGGYELSIDMYRTTYGSSTEGVRIFVNSSDTVDANAVEIGFISNDINTPSTINGDIIGAETSAGWYTYELPIENLTGVNYIILEGNSQYVTASYIDNIVVREMPTCRKPTGVAVNNVSQNSAEISWTAQSGETSWEIEVNGEEIIPASANPYTFTNLDADEDYTIRVRAVCSETDSSDWSAAASFATYMCEPAPTSVDNNGISAVVFGQNQAVNQTSGHPTSAPYYADLTSVVGDAAAGTYATIDITYNTGWTYGTVVWVNWNNDLALTDDEVVVTGTSTSSSPSTLHLSFYVPANTPLGNYTMRIGGADSHLDAAINAGSGYDPCYEGSYAIYEDYTLQITEAPSCLMPIDLTVDSITTNTATISWNALGDETSWVVRVDGVDEVVTTNPYTITGLPSSSAHTVSVAALCSATDTSLFSPIASFFTECEVVVVDDSNEYNYGFEDETFGCWTVEVSDPDDNGWELAPFDAHSGSQSAYFVSYDVARLVSPVFDLTGITTEPQLTFWHIQPSNYGSVDYLSVYYRTEADGQWMLLTNFTASITAYQSDTLILPANTYQISFLGTDNYGNGANVDDIRISAALPPCEAPINVAIDQYGTITWEDTGEGLNWTIYYSINGVENTVNAANNIYTLSGLNEGDLIAAYVQANCSENRTSPLSVTITSTYTTGIANYNALEAKVFPNPTTGNVHISLAHTNLSQMEVQVFDIFGKKVMTQMVESEDFDLDFSAFAPGMYMMRIGNANQFAQVKVVKE